jgi:histidinol-phosphate aminotransferase
MGLKHSSTRRRFLRNLTAALGCGSLPPSVFPAAVRGADPAVADTQEASPPSAYDMMVKLSMNENPYGPSEAVMKAMTGAWKYASRYGYPDGGIIEAIAEHHGVEPANVLIGAGSAEILKAADDTFLPDHRKLVGVEPTFEAVYRFATNSKAQALVVPLREDHAVDMQEIIRVTRLNARDVGLVYVCNPNNPTGNVVHKDEIRLLLDSIPEQIPVLIDEAYHHFVDNPDYEPSLKYVLQGRKVIVTRTFSKIAALAGMRLGYGIAPKDLISQMRPFTYGSVNALVKHGGVAALKDTAHQAKMKELNKQVREQTMTELKKMGCELIRSDANFFMVKVNRDVTQVGEEFWKRGILVGRKFSPMDQWLRVSVGSAADMEKFMSVFREIFPAREAA